MNLYRDSSAYPKVKAQDNLSGRTHYVDDDTLRFHRSKVISAHVVDNGLLFAIVTSDSLDYEHTKRGFRFVVFDVFGTVLERTELEGAFRKSEQAKKAMWAWLNAFDAIGHTRDAIVKARHSFERECEELHQRVNAIESSNKAA